MFKNTRIIILLLLFGVGMIRAQEKFRLVEIVNLNVGVTLFKNQFKKDQYRNSSFSTVAKALTLGLELYNKPANLSIEVRKTYWLGVSASSYSTDITATASYNQIGVTKYFDFANHKRKLGINVSHIWMAEYSTWSGLGNANTVGYFIIDTYWSSKSISLASSINLTKNLYTELKFNYYYFISDYYKNNNFSVPSKGIDENRIQLSFIYKIHKKLQD
jgi:hypothetical protein